MCQNTHVHSTKKAINGFDTSYLGRTNILSKFAFSKRMGARRKWHWRVCQLERSQWQLTLEVVLGGVLRFGWAFPLKWKNINGSWLGLILFPLSLTAEGRAGRQPNISHHMNPVLWNMLPVKVWMDIMKWDLAQLGRNWSLNREKNYKFIAKTYVGWQHAFYVGNTQQYATCLGVWFRRNGQLGPI